MKVLKFFLKSFSLRIFFSSSTITSSIFTPLFAIALLASLLDDKILLSAIKFKIFIPFSISLDLIFISGKPEPKPLPSNVSFAVASAFLEAFSP